MFLKKLNVNGFKSFCDPAEITFDKGVSAIVGPNGCGKSNIVDAIKWVVGEQKTKDLRAGSMTDVIFKGTESRKGLGRAEVKLTIVNDDNILPKEFNEVEITRVIYASGENEYYINKKQVRLKDIQELFFDTGIGKSAYSVMEQGKIDNILLSKPEDRRYLIEEAAGITKYRVKREEANNQLVSAESNLERVRDIIKEVKSQYDHMIDQAKKAEKYKEYHDKEFTLEIELNINRILKQKKEKNEYTEELEKAQKDLDDIKVRIDSLDDSYKDRMIYVNELETQRIDKDRDGFKIDSDIKVIEVSSNTLKDQLIGLNTTLKLEKERISGAEKRLKDISEELASINQAKQDINEKIASMMKEETFYNQDIVNIGTQISDNEQEIVTLKNKSIELNNLLEKMRIEHKDVTDKMIERIDQILASIDVDSTQITEIKEGLQTNIKKIYEELPKRVAFIDDIIRSDYLSNNSSELVRILKDLRDNIADLEDTFAHVHNDINTYIKTTEVFMDDLFSPEGIIQTKKRVEEDIQKTADEVKECAIKIEQLQEANKELSVRKEKSRDMLHEVQKNISTMEEKHNSFDSQVSHVYSLQSQIEMSRDEATKNVEFTENKIEEIRDEIAEKESELVGLRNQKRNLEKEIQQIVMEIQKENAKASDEQRYVKEVNLRYQNKNNQITRLNGKIIEIDTNINNIYQTFYENFSENLTEYESKGGYGSNRSYEDVRKELSDVKSARQALGNVNLMAIEECKILEDRYKLLQEQMTDLEKAKKDIQEMILEINKISEELFLKTFNQIKINFRQMFRKLFDGGNAEIILTQPNNLITTGIEIYAQPPGQSRKSISLLSGGQKTMTAIALLFATFLVKPSPFCILDEMDAALDEENVTQFVKLLQEFKDISQFVIISHNKKTLTAADIMYGVTQEQKGISKIISAKLGDFTQR